MLLKLGVQQLKNNHIYVCVYVCVYIEILEKKGSVQFSSVQ